MENLKKMDGHANVEAASDLKRDYMMAAEKLTDAAKQTKFSADKAFESIAKYSRENPAKAMGIAAAVGALVSLALVKALSRKVGI